MNQQKMEVIAGLVETFSSIYPVRQGTVQDRIDAYQKALSRYRIEDIKAAGYRCLENARRFPLPAEIIEAMDIRSYDPDARSDFLIIDDGRCTKCGHKGSVIREPKDSSVYRCRRCYTGLTTEQIEQRHRDLARMIDEPGWRPGWYYTVRGERAPTVADDSAPF